MEERGEPEEDEKAGIVDLKVWGRFSFGVRKEVRSNEDLQTWEFIHKKSKEKCVCVSLVES